MKIEAKNAFAVLEDMQLKNRVKELEADNAELVKSNEELRERCKKLASRVPEWPKVTDPLVGLLRRKRNMNVNLIDVMGTDLSVVNAARVSFAKESNEFSEKMQNSLTILQNTIIGVLLVMHLCSSESKLQSLLQDNLVKHQVGLVWNEVSRRYVDDEPEFYIPSEWRLKADDKKQGSSDETIEYNLGSTLEFIKTTYQNMLKANIAPEMARMISTTELIYRVVLEWYIDGICKSM